MVGGGGEGGGPSVAAWILTGNYLYGSGSFHQQAKKSGFRIRITLMRIRIRIQLLLMLNALRFNADTDPDWILIEVM